MPKVPSYNRQIGLDTARVPTPKAPDSGIVLQSINKVYDANQSIAKGVGDVANVLSTYAVKRQKDIDEAQVAENETNFRLDMQNSLFSKDKKKIIRDGKEIEVYSGYLNRDLDTASGITPEFDADYQALKQKHLSGLRTKEQQLALSKAMDSQYLSARSTIINHEGDQFRKSLANKFENNAKQIIASGSTIFDPIKLAESIDKLNIKYQQIGDTFGYDAETVAYNQKDKAGDLVENSVMSTIMTTKDPERARTILSSAKDRMLPDRFNKIQDNISKSFKVMSESLQDELNSKFIDGTITLEDIQAAATPKENGGIGGTAAKAMLKNLGQVQQQEVTALSNNYDRAEKYLNVIDKAVLSPVDHYKLREILVQAYADGELLGDEPKKLDKIQNIVSRNGFNASHPALINIGIIKSWFGANDNDKRELASILDNYLTEVGEGKNPDDVKDNLLKKQYNKLYPEYPLGKEDKLNDPSRERQLFFMPAISRFAKGIAYGASGSVSSFGGSLRWLGAQDIGKQIEEYGKTAMKFYAPKDPKFIDQVASGFGSMGTFFIPGVGIARGVQAATAFPRLAAWLGISASTALEATVEAGSTYQRGIEKGMSHKDSSNAASKDFWANIPTLAITNRLGLFGDKGGLIAKSIKSAGFEGFQEFSQSVLGNIFVNDPAMQGAFESAAVGAIVGGGTKLSVDSVGALKELKEAKDKLDEPPSDSGQGAPINPDEPIVNPTTDVGKDNIVRDENGKPIEMGNIKNAPIVASSQQSKQSFEMNAQELDYAINNKKKSDKNIDIEVLGEDGAKRYNMLQRQANSINNPELADKASAEIQKIEDSLTESQRNKLFGIGDEEIQVDELKAIRDSIGRIDGSTEKELGDSLKYAITKLPESSNPKDWNLSQKEAVAQFAQAVRISNEKGFDLNKVSESALKGSFDRFSDPEDARFMLRRFMSMSSNKLSSESGFLRIPDLPQVPKEVKKDFKQFSDASLVPLSTRLAKIHPSLRDALRKFEFNKGIHTHEDVQRAMPFMEHMASLPEQDSSALDLALKNADRETINEIVDRNGIRQEYEQTRDLLDDLYNRAKEAGLDVNYIDEYFPRRVNNPDEFMDYLRNSKNWSAIDKAIKQEEAKLGTSLNNEERAEFINKMIRGYGESKLNISKPSNTKERKIRVIDEQMNAFYKNSATTLQEYILAMNSAIEAKRFFGVSGKNLEDSIGSYVRDLVDNGLINHSQEREVRDIVTARFQQKGMNGIWSLYKNLGYLYTMSSPISAITQIGDLAFSLYENGFYHSLSGLKSAFSKDKITKQDIGIDVIAHEFSDNSKSGEAVRKVFKLIGLEAMDNMGKETIVNGALDKLSKQANENDQGLIKELDRVFGEESKQTLEDLKNKVPSVNVKYMLFSRLAKYQPITLSEMPEYYSTGYAGPIPGRIFYMLKSYTIKQLDVFHNEVMMQFKDNPKKAMGNLIKLAVALASMNAGADVIKDVLLGRPIKLSDIAVDNILKLVGFSKYTIYKARREGLGEAIQKTILPPVPFVDDLYKDIKAKDKDVGDYKFWQALPVVGKFYYWWFGGGRESLDRKSKSKNIRAAFN